MPDLSLILGQLKQQMTPEQRAMLEKQGVTMAGKGVQVCLTPAQVASDLIPLTDPQSGPAGSDRQERQPMEIPFQLPESPRYRGRHLKSQKEFTTTVNGTFNATGIQQKGSLTAMRNGWATIAVRSNRALNAGRVTANFSWKPMNTRSPTAQDDRVFVDAGRFGDHFQIAESIPLRTAACPTPHTRC